MVLKLINNVSKNTIEFEVNDKQSSTIFYQFDITLPEGCIDGEYNYELIDNEKIVATGLLQIGDYEKDFKENKEYENNNTDTIVYNG